MDGKEKSENDLKILYGQGKRTAKGAEKNEGFKKNGREPMFHGWISPGRWDGIGIG